MISIIQVGHLVNCKCINCNKEIKVGFKLEIGITEFIICNECKRKVGTMLSFKDNKDHILLSTGEIY